MLVGENISKCDPRGSSYTRSLNQGRFCGVLSVTLLDHLHSHALHDLDHVPALHFALDLRAVGPMKVVVEGVEKKDLPLTLVEGPSIGFRESSSPDR